MPVDQRKSKAEQQAAQYLSVSLLRIYNRPRMNAFNVVISIALLTQFVVVGGSATTNGIRRDLPLKMSPSKWNERQITFAKKGHLLTNAGVWSADSNWIVYDTRSDAAGDVFDGEEIEMVNITTGEVRILYRAGNGAHCGVVTFHPLLHQVAFILGPENPTPDWQYAAWHRGGCIVDTERPGVARHLDARDITAPFTPGALRGGSHVHVWDAAGDWVSFTYEDHILAQFNAATSTNDINLRNIGVGLPKRPVRVSPDHERNTDGDYFSVLVTHTTSRPQPGSDEIRRACEEAWVGTNGYLRADGSRQRRALAFQGQVIAANGEPVVEAYIVDLTEDPTVMGEGPLCGTETRAPAPPKGVIQRRLTFTTDRKFPGIQGVRHWLKSSPDGSKISFLMRDEFGIVQIWTVSPNGGTPRQLTHNRWSIASAFTWHPDGSQIVHVMDSSVCVTDILTGETTRLTERNEDGAAPRPEACVFSPDGSKIAFVRRVASQGLVHNQICVLFRGL